MEIMNLCWDVGSFSKLSRRCASKESYVVQTQNNVSAPKLQNKALRIVLHENPRDLSEASLGGVLWPTTPLGREGLRSRSVASGNPLLVGIWGLAYRLVRGQRLLSGQCWTAA